MYGRSRVKLKFNFAQLLRLSATFDSRSIYLYAYAGKNIATVEFLLMCCALSEFYLSKILQTARNFANEVNFSF